MGHLLVDLEKKGSLAMNPEKEFIFWDRFPMVSEDPHFMNNNSLVVICWWDPHCWLPIIHPSLIFLPMKRGRDLPCPIRTTQITFLFASILTNQSHMIWTWKPHLGKIGNGGGDFCKGDLPFVSVEHNFGCYPNLYHLGGSSFS